MPSTPFPDLKIKSRSSSSIPHPYTVSCCAKVTSAQGLVDEHMEKPIGLYDTGYLIPKARFQKMVYASTSAFDSFSSSCFIF